MTPREGIYYVGMIAGMVAGVSVARALGWHQLVGLVCGIALGWPAGYFCEKLYSSNMSGNRSARPKVKCSNPACQWSGDADPSGTCPRCGNELSSNSDM